MKYEIGPRIKKYREAQKLNQTEFASRVGESLSTVSNWETGKHRPNVDKLARICEILNVSPSELLDVHLSPDEDISLQERNIISQYRKKPDMRKAVNKLLGLADSCNQNACSSCKNDQ